MQIQLASAEGLISNADMLRNMASSLANGDEVFIEPLRGKKLDSISALSYTPEFARLVESGRDAITTFRGPSEWSLPGVATIAPEKPVCQLLGEEYAIPKLLDLLKAVHPTYALVFDAACAAVGCALDGTEGSRKFELEVAEDGFVGIKPARVSMKAKNGA